MKNKVYNIKIIIYSDIMINILLSLIILLSLLSNTFSIIPVKLTQHFLGINVLQDIFKLFHYTLLGISLTFIIQSFILLAEHSKNKILGTSIIKLFFYKWLILTINSTIPYLFGFSIPIIFFIINTIILSIIWYVKLDINQIEK